MFKKIIQTVLLMFTLLLPVSGIDLVRDGALRCAILAGSDIVEQFAATELSSYIEKISGVTVPVIEQELSDRVMIRFELIGDAADSSPAAGVRHDGFMINASDREMVISSRHRRGFLYGVYHILRNNGVEWFYPGEEGEFVEKRMTVSVTAGVRVVNPAFEDRQFRLNGGPGYVKDTYDWLIRNGVQVYEEFPNMDKYDPIVCIGGHILTQMLVGSKAKADWEALFAERPELFGMTGGKRVRAAWYSSSPDVRQPCTSNPEVVRRICENSKKLVDQYGKDRELVFDFCADDHGFWCECENCRSLDSPEEREKQQYSTRWWLLLNEVAATLPSHEYPNLSLRMMAYLNFLEVPVGVKPAADVQVTYCSMSRCYVHAIDDPACERNILRYKPRFDAWTQSGAKITNFEYHNCLPTVSNYVPFERAWVADMKYRHRLGMCGAGLVTCPPDGNYNTERNKSAYNRLNVWYSQWQLHWLTAYFLWNIDDDYETVWDRVSSKYYGKSWPAMRKYRLVLEKAIEDFGEPLHLISHRHLLPRIYAEPGVARELNSLLEEAMLRSADEPVVLRRICREREYLYRNYALNIDLASIEKYSGKLVFNGDFEVHTQYYPPNKAGRLSFEPRNGIEPCLWLFKPGSDGYSEIREDSPCQGKYYLRISGESISVNQMLGRIKDPCEAVKVSARVRGKGKLQFSISAKLDQSTRLYFGPAFNGQWFDIDSEEWILLEDIIQCPSQDLIGFSVKGRLDLDEVAAEGVRVFVDGQGD